MNSRIQPIDGLRAFAAFGVVWIHSWSYFKNPSLNIFSIDLYQSVAILGNGVDFFFVISGFCMYLMTGKKYFNKTTYFTFLYKRFLRIAPAFYLAVLVYAVLIKIVNPGFAFGYNVFFHLLFLNNVITGNSISGPFWSIGTEWHFYLVLPFFVFLSHKYSLLKAVVICSIASLVFFAFVNLGYLSYAWWESQVLIRFPEFAVGIIAAWFFIKGNKLPRLLKGRKGLLIAITIMYLGRLMKFTPVITYAGETGFIFKTLADTIMTTGFGLLMFHVITEPGRLAQWLSGKIITWLGRISFSIYLWHSLAFIILHSWLQKLPFGYLNPVIGFVLVSLLTILISHYSYKYLEAFYFKLKPKEPVTYPLPGNV